MMKDFIIGHLIMMLTYKGRCGMIKFSELENEGFEGCDADLDISLYEYGLIWKKEEDDNYLFYYGTSLNNVGEYYLFDFAHMSKEDWIELLNESWVNMNDVLSFCDIKKKDFINNFPYDVNTMIMYYGYENIFGSSYNPFKIGLED